MPMLQDITRLSSATTALDMFTDTARVVQAFKGAGVVTGANDTTTYAKILADCYIKTNARDTDFRSLHKILKDLAGTPARPGYFTETSYVESRLPQPKSGTRIDAIREHIETEYTDTPLYPVLLTFLMEATDRIDSTTGQQMAYLRTWALRACDGLELRVPELLDSGRWTQHVDANELAGYLARRDSVNLGDTGCGDGAQVGAGLDAAREDALSGFDLVYLDLPYNQHRYFANYHIWETLVRWNAPEAYGVTCEHVDARDPDTHSPYNHQRRMPQALASLVAIIPCQTLVLSYNNGAWVNLEELFTLIVARFKDAAVLAFDSKRYVGAQIGIYSPIGQRVGKISHLRNLEYVFVGSSHEVVSTVHDDFASLGTTVHV